MLEEEPRTGELPQEERHNTRLMIVGPFPPPINGQSVVMEHIFSRVAPHFYQARIADTGAGDSKRWLRPITSAFRSAKAAFELMAGRPEAVYIAVKAGKGMWLTAGIVGVARCLGVRLFLHHHSYAYVRRRAFRMVALARIAGPSAHHIVLSNSMADDLAAAMPEIRRILVIGNAGLIDKELLNIPLQADPTHLVLGHLSSLSVEKGIGDVVDLALELHAAQVAVRLIIGGPVESRQTADQLSRAALHLGDLFDYRGVLKGQAKIDFFADITHFIFPSRYTHEASPLVLYEALASGVVCMTTQQGAIRDQLNGSPSFISTRPEFFVDEAIRVLSREPRTQRVAEMSRKAYLRALEESEYQLTRFVEALNGDL